MFEFEPDPFTPEEADGLRRRYVAKLRAVGLGFGTLADAVEVDAPAELIVVILDRVMADTTEAMEMARELSR